MSPPFPTDDPARIETLLSRLSKLLDRAAVPLQKLDGRHIEEFRVQQEELTRELSTVLADPQHGDTPNTKMVTEVRRKLLRNQLMVAHVLDFTSKLRERVGQDNLPGYSQDGQEKSTADKTNLLLRTSY